MKKEIIKLLKLPYKSKNEEWLTRGEITKKVNQRCSIDYSSSLSYFHGINCLNFDFFILPNYKFILLFEHNGDLHKERFKFLGFILGKRTNQIQYINENEPEKIAEKIYNKLQNELEVKIITDLKDLIKKYERHELEIISKIKDLIENK